MSELSPRQNRKELFTSYNVKSVESIESDNPLIGGKTLEELNARITALHQAGDIKGCHSYFLSEKQVAKLITEKTAPIPKSELDTKKQD